MALEKKLTKRMQVAFVCHNTCNWHKELCLPEMLIEELSDEDVELQLGSQSLNPKTKHIETH